uniref:Uracil-DNA glycosylase n=1 Tax=Panagrolaimus sp. ES5 TaxID=591445 RepID=A0AC34F4U1_9BILA
METDELSLTAEQVYNDLLFSIHCPDWFQFVAKEMKENYFEKIFYGLAREILAENTFFPAMNDIFKMFNLTEYKDVKVVIIGQDPYPSLGKATGLAFSVEKGVTIPASLANMFKSIKRDENVNAKFKHGDLTPWAKQGVLLLNTYLTVPENDSMGHRKIGWKEFTKRVVEHISQTKPNAIFLLMGQTAQEHASHLNENVVVKCAHPSPHSAPKFFENTPFLDVNTKLMASGQIPINWTTGFVD